MRVLLPSLKIDCLGSQCLACRFKDFENGICTLYNVGLVELGEIGDQVCGETRRCNQCLQDDITVRN